MRTILSLILCLVVGVGAARAETRTVRYGERDGLSSHRVGGGVADSHGLLWFATWKGLNCYDGYEFYQVRIEPGEKSSISTDRIRDIILDPAGSGNIICRTDDDIYEFDLREYRFHDIDSARKASLRPLVGKTWHGMTDPQGGRWESNRSGLEKRFSVSHPARAISATAGLNVRSMITDGFGVKAAGISGDSTCLIEFGGDADGEFVSPLDNSPYCLLYDSIAGRILAGCKPGGIYVKSAMPAPRQYACDAPVYDMAIDGYGRLWLATLGGGIKMIDLRADGRDYRVADASTGEFADARVRKLLITPSGLLIAATTDGVLTARLPEKGETMLNLRAVRRRKGDSGSLATNSTMSVARDARGRIFVATESAGVDMIDEDSLLTSRPVFTHLNTSTTRLTSDACEALMAGPDSLITVVGMSRVSLLNPDSGEALCLNEPFWGDSCSFTECTPHLLDDGTIVLASDRGILMASPDSIRHIGYMPPIVFTTLSTRGAPARFRLPPASTVRLKADERDITVGFAAIDYVDNRHILYQTSLDGSAWSAASPARTVTLFGLGPGKHTLRVRSTDRYGRRVDNTRELTITVEPRWHETWWARILFAIATVGIIAAIAATAIYIRRLKRRRRELLQKYMELISARETTPGNDSDSGSDAGTLPETALDINGQDSALLERVRRYVEENISNPDANVADMAAAAAASRATLNRKLKSNLGVSASQLLMEARMRRAAELQGDTDLTVADVSERCGYADAHYFQRVFAKRFGAPFRSARSGGWQGQP